MILVATMASTMFLGGWLSPVPDVLANAIALPWIAADGFPWLAVKVAFVLLCFLWFRATFPRYRYDQLMRLGWKVFLPASLFWLVLTSGVLVAFGWAPA